MDVLIGENVKIMKILTYVIAAVTKKLTEIRRYATTVSHLKRLNANPKISSPGLLEAYLYQLKERIYFINLILSLLILQTKRNLLHLELSQLTI